mgnify:CR=1 FL=1
MVSGMIFVELGGIEWSPVGIFVTWKSVMFVKIVLYLIIAQIIAFL